MPDRREPTFSGSRRGRGAVGVLVAIVHTGYATDERALFGEGIGRYPKLGLTAGAHAQREADEFGCCRDGFAHGAHAQASGWILVLLGDVL